MSASRRTNPDRASALRSVTAKLIIFSQSLAIHNLKFGVILRKRIELNITNDP